MSQKQRPTAASIAYAIVEKEMSELTSIVREEGSRRQKEMSQHRTLPPPSKAVTQLLDSIGYRGRTPLFSKNKKGSMRLTKAKVSGIKVSKSK